MGEWESWIGGFCAGAQIQVHGSSCGSFGLMEHFNTIPRLCQEKANESFKINKISHKMSKVVSVS